MNQSWIRWTSITGDFCLTVANFVRSSCVKACSFMSCMIKSVTQVNQYLQNSVEYSPLIKKVHFSTECIRASNTCQCTASPRRWYFLIVNLRAAWGCHAKYAASCSKDGCIRKIKMSKVVLGLLLSLHILWDPAILGVLVSTTPA